MDNEIETVWTKRESRRGIEPMLLAKKINKDWLESEIGVTSIRFTGGLLSALTDLRDAVKATKKNLPTNSLRLMLQASMDGVIHVDRDLGCNTKNQLPAIFLHQSEASDEETSKIVSDQVRSWCINTLEVWAQREQFGDLAIRVKKAALPENISVASSSQPLRDPQTGSPNFTLIARLIANQLSGEELFEGMGPCEIVLPESPYMSSIDLMSAPRKPVNEAGGKNAFSMIARVNVSTAPYSKDVYFSVSCSKRVWAEKSPDGGNTGSNATGYVMAPGRQVIPVSVIKRKIDDVWGWDFDSEYASLNIEARGALPPNLSSALAHSAYDKTRWWVGLPQITRLYRRVDQHTSLESDEVDLLRSVTPMLAGMVDADVPMTARRLRLNKRPESAMLRLQDVGAAGVSIAELEDEEPAEEIEIDDDFVVEGERDSVARFREQCISVLEKSCPASGAKPCLWIIGGTQQEQDLARKTAEIVFGDAIETKVDPLPPGVHGLKSQLPGADFKSRQRFDRRVSAWMDSGLPQAIAQHDGARFVLICAPKEIDRRSEDSVNRRAAIHAMCSIAHANVHHLLPIEAAHTPARVAKSTQSFIHRMQSAMMDVMLAHSGYVIGANDFVAGQLEEDHRPHSIYGIQALRKQAQRYSGETAVCMIIYSRLNLQTCITEVSFVYKAAGGTRKSDWMPLARGLVWLGCQRNMEGDEAWLKIEFKRSTITALTEVRAHDPRAIVFVDWGTVAGLWSELTDASLLKKAPALEHVDLASNFPQMSFARLRYGRDAKMPLRSWSKTIFEGFREEASRAATGAYFEDGYAVTVKQLVEINPDPSEPGRGHFVGVMSPRKTFQLKRGKSCFRFMIRMSPADKEGAEKNTKGIFVKTTMAPADKDATIPSSMDITVLQSPSGIAPVEIATLAMGLRVGYAHYDDWTMLPAPLFFARKIDDYIVKYPVAETDFEDVQISVEASEVGVVEAIPATASGDPGGSTAEEDVAFALDSFASNEATKLRLVTKQVQRELNLDFGQSDPPDDSVEVGGDKSSPAFDALASFTDDIEPQADVDPLTLADEELIDYARGVGLIQLYPAPNIKIRRIYSSMLQGKIKIQVDPPYFVKIPGFFGQYSPDLKKNIQQSWKQILDFGFVQANKPRPDFIYYLDWLSDKLRHPQGAYVVDSVLLFGRALIMPVVDKIFKEYVESLEGTETESSGGGLADLEDIVLKACSEEDDRALGWMVFAAAQTPSFGFADAVIKNLALIPGPMTRAALHYYIDCARSIKLAVQQFESSGVTRFREIHVHRKYHPPPLVAQSVHTLTVTAAAVQTLANGSEKVDAPQRTSEIEDPALLSNIGSTHLGGKIEKSEIEEEVMQMKAEIKSLIDQIEPGSDAFPAICLQVVQLIDKLRIVDLEQRESRKLADENIAKRTVLCTFAEGVLVRLKAVDDEGIVGHFRFINPDLDKLENAQAEVDHVERALCKVETPFNQLMECLDNPLKAGATRSEHSRRAEQVSGLNASVNDELVQVKQALEVATCFVPTENPVPPSPSVDEDGQGPESTILSVADETDITDSPQPQAIEASASDDANSIAPLPAPDAAPFAIVEAVVSEDQVLGAPLDGNTSTVQSEKKAVEIDSFVSTRDTAQLIGANVEASISDQKPFEKPDQHGKKARPILALSGRSEIQAAINSVMAADHGHAHLLTMGAAQPNASSSDPKESLITIEITGPSASTKSSVDVLKDSVNTEQVPGSSHLIEIEEVKASDLAPPAMHQPLAKEVQITKAKAPTAIDTPPASPAQTTPSSQSAVLAAAPAVRHPEIHASDLSSNENALQAAYGRLKKMMELRHYGLAGVYIDAMETSFDDANVRKSAAVLIALNETLESIDCQFVVDPKLNPDLRTFLLQSNPCNGLANYTDLGVLAAGFLSAVFSAQQGAGAGVEGDSLWTVVGPIRQSLARLQSITRLIDHIVSRETKGVILTREKFSGSKIGVKMALAKEIERAVNRAANWKKDSEIHGSWSHHGFSRMHEFIYGPKHAIGQCVALVAHNDVQGLNKAFSEAQSKFFRKPAATVIEAFKAVGEKSKPDGRYSVNAAENITITENFIKNFLDISTNRVTGRDEMLPHELDYLNELHARLSESISELESLHPELLLEQIYVKAAKSTFEAVLRLFSEENSGTCMPLQNQKLLIQQPMDRFMNPSMHDCEETGMKAVCSGESVIRVVDDLLVEDLSAMSSPIPEDDLNKLMLEAQRTHLQGRRFLPAFYIEGVLPKGFTKLDPSLLQQYQKAKADLSHDLQEARQRVTHAMALSALDQKDSSHLLNIIEGIHTSNSAERAIGHPEGASSAYPDFPHALATLQNQVIKVLDTRLEEAKDKLLGVLKEYEESHGDESAKDVARIRAMLSTNNPASIRTAHDACAILRNGGKLPTYVRDSRRIAPKEFEEFLISAQKIRGQNSLLDALEMALVSSPAGGDPLLVSLNAAQRIEAAEFIAKWKDLCSRKGEDAAIHAGNFFAALGISAPIYMPERTGRHLPSKFEFPEKAFSALSSSDCFIPPALGSAARTVVGYVVNGHHPESEISTLIQDVSSVPTFILSRTGLSLQKRAKLSGQALVLLIDDHLIAYMAVHPEDRARRMMEICTLTFHTVPYSAEGTYVPREMFFGRQRELISLRAVKSLAILYGGRRLGKSSLLAKIEREESTVSGSLAIYIPMDRDYAGNDHVLFGWRKLAGALASRNVIEAVPSGINDWKEIREWVEKKLVDDGQKIKSCYLLFDEADNIMAHELDLAEGATGFIRSLQQTAENIHSKFHLRFVIAGLHNLARMTTESNSALGKAETIALEPFSSDDDILRGVELVTKPMAALGFFFGPGSEDLPLRILSICNFYPAFIQIYCRKLLEHMYNKRGTREAYAFISVDDLEAVERDHDLLTELQQKFSWTLDLDKRYKAIALILADFYYTDVESGKNEGLSVSDIRTWCEVLVPNHFVGLSSGAYEGLLDEMKKLNVLEKHGSRYRLRNPSIATLIGDRQRIELQLKSLADATPEKARNYGDRRNALLPKNADHSGTSSPIFPMPVAWIHSQMEGIDGGLVILGGNYLSGLIEVSAPRGEWLLTQNHFYNSMALNVSSAATQIAKLRRNVESFPKGSKLLLVSSSGAWKASDIPQFAANASKAANAGIRLALVALPDRLYEIAMALEQGSLVAGSDKKFAWSVSPVPAWGIDALRLHLRDNNAVADDTDACRAILEASCGFGKQIQSICASNLSVEKAMGLVESARTNLAPSLSAFYDKIGMPKAISADVLKNMEGFMEMINGEQRNSPRVDEYLSEFNLKATDLQFLNWMGLVQEGDGNTWHIPALYSRLLGS